MSFRDDRKKPPGPLNNENYYQNVKTNIRFGILLKVNQFMDAFWYYDSSKDNCSIKIINIFTVVITEMLKHTK